MLLFISEVMCNSNAVIRQDFRKLRFQMIDDRKQRAKRFGECSTRFPAISSAASGRIRGRRFRRLRARAMRPSASACATLAVSNSEQRRLLDGKRTVEAASRQAWSMCGISLRDSGNRLFATNTLKSSKKLRRRIILKLSEPSKLSKRGAYLLIRELPSFVAAQS